MSDESTAESIGAALGRIAELFGAVCGDPDNPEVAAAADRALADLDALMAG